MAPSSASCRASYIFLDNFQIISWCPLIDAPDFYLPIDITDGIVVLFTMRAVSSAHCCCDVAGCGCGCGCSGGVAVRVCNVQSAAVQDSVESTKNTWIVRRQSIRRVDVLIDSWAAA